MYRNSGSPADNDYIGEIQFEGRNDNSQDVVYAGLAARILDASDGTEDGRFELFTVRAGSQISTMVTTDTELIFNNDSIDFDFRVESNGQANMLFVDGGNDRVGVGTGTPATTLDIRTSDGSDAKLRLGSSSSIGLDVLGTIEFFSADVDDSGIKASIHNLSTGNQGPGGSLSGNLIFSTTASDGGGNDSPTERMRLDKDGQLGIGTNSPNSLLDIKDVHSQLRLTDSDDDKFILFSYSGGKLVTRNNDTSTTVNQFTLTEDGDFGIGTINPAHPRS